MNSVCQLLIHSRYDNFLCVLQEVFKNIDIEKKNLKFYLHFLKSNVLIWIQSKEENKNDCSSRY